MDISTAVVIAVVLLIGLWVPYYLWYIRRGRAHGHTWFTWWKPRGHPDIGAGPRWASTDSTRRRRCARGSLLTQPDRALAA